LSCFSLEGLLLNIVNRYYFGVHKRQIRWWPQCRKFYIETKLTVLLNTFFVNRKSDFDRKNKKGPCMYIPWLSNGIPFFNSKTITSVIFNLNHAKNENIAVSFHRIFVTTLHFINRIVSTWRPNIKKNNDYPSIGRIELYIWEERVITEENITTWLPHTKLIVMNGFNGHKKVKEKKLLH